MSLRTLASREWPFITVTVVLALVLVGLAQAFVIMITHIDACSGDLPPDIAYAPNAHLCLQQHLSTTSEWLDAWLVRIVGMVGLFTAWTLRKSHQIVLTDARRGEIRREASVWFAYDTTIYWLLFFGVVAVILNVLAYTNGLQP